MQVKCIQKFRGKHNKIIGYRLVDDKGNVKDVKAEKLKEVIAAGKLSVVNLTLTADGRLVTTSEKDTKNEAASKAKTVQHQQNEQNSIIVKDHQPIFFHHLLDDLYLKDAEMLKFKIVNSLDGIIDNIIDKCRTLGAKVDKITNDMYMVYSTDNKVVTIVSEAPVRILAEEADCAIGNWFKTIDFRNADLSHIKSLDNVAGKASSAKVVQHSLDEIKKLNHSIISRYKYKKPDPFNNKEADRGLAAANSLCHIWTWPWDRREIDDVFDDFIANACESIEKEYGMYGLGRQDTSYISYLLELNWDAVESADNMSFSYTETVATWAISRVLATHDLMSHLDNIVKDYTNPIYHSLTNKNIESAMEGGLAKKDVLEQIDYGVTINGTYEEFMDIIRERVCDYGTKKFSGHLETCIKYFKSTGDKRALAHFSEIYKCINEIINYINNSAKNKLKVIEDGMKKLDRLLGENFNVHIKLQKSAVNDKILYYEAITDKLFIVDDKIAQALNVDKRLIGANVCILVSLEYYVVGEDASDDDTDDRFMQLVIDKPIKESSDVKYSSDSLIHCTGIDCGSALSLSNLQDSIDEFKEEYDSFMKKLENTKGSNNTSQVKAKTVRPKNKTNITGSELVEAIKRGYNTFLKEVCLNESLIIDFEDVLYNLDSWLSEHIGMELIKADDDLTEKFNLIKAFSLSDLQLDISDKRVYDQLVEIINDEDIQEDYQYKDFINNLAKSINKHNKAQGNTYEARLDDFFDEED